MSLMLTSAFDANKLSVGTPVKVITIEGDVTVGIVTMFSLDKIEVSSYDSQGFPTSCQIDREQVLEEVVDLEVIA